MADGSKIGLNEVELGIPVPRYWAGLMARVVSAGVAEKLCLFAQMATAQQALSVGMVDEVVPMAQCVPVCPLETYTNISAIQMPARTLISDISISLASA